MTDNFKIFTVGDFHATFEELEECKKLIDFIINNSIKYNTDIICFMGDLFHTHNIINSFVLNFWRESFHKLCIKYNFKVFVLLGNHDKPSVGIDTKKHSLSVFKKIYDNLTIIDEPLVYNNILFVPHYYDNEIFVKECNKYKEINTVYCHQEFNGCEYENGFYSKSGAKQDSIYQKTIIGAHIHKQSTMGKVWYIGSPRWRSVSDANEEKGIWVIEHDKLGNIVERIFIDTSDVCKPIISLKDYPDKPVIIPNKNATIIIDIYGPECHVEKRNKELSGKGYKIRSFIDKKEQIKIKESEGLDTAFKKYLDSYIPKNGTNKNRLLEMSMEKIEWMKKK